MAVLRAIGWLVWTVAQRRVALAGDLDRERAASSLREGYAGGYLTLDELSRRTGRALSARSRGELRRALSGLSRGSALESVQTAVREIVFVVLACAYVFFSVVLVLAFAATLILHGASVQILLAFLAVWLFPTYLLSRLWRRKPSN